MTALFLGLVLLLSAPTLAEAQTSWPDFVEGLDGRDDEGHLAWVVGSYLPASHLGSFGRYGVLMDPWVTLGVSARSGSAEDRFRTRFEMTLTPDANMRLSFRDCADCTHDSRRLTVANWRFLLDVTAGLPDGSRGYLTGGPLMRIQLGGEEPCYESAGDGCALAEFGRSRVDPGMMLGAGWEPDASWIRAIQVSGRVIHYGKEEMPEASPVSWLPALELSAHFPLSF